MHLYIICIYNGEQILNDSINSLINQDYPNENYEIVPLDDGSRDNCSVICEKIISERKSLFPIIRYAYQNNSGLAKARNSGISISSGQIVVFIDQDAIAKSNWLDELMKQFLHKGADYVGGRVELLNQNSSF